MPALQLLLQEVPGAEGGGFTPFSINPGLILWTVVVFGLLLALLWKFGWPTILKSVEDRERRIQQQLEEAERARAEAARLLEEHKRTPWAKRSGRESWSGPEPSRTCCWSGRARRSRARRRRRCSPCAAKRWT